MVPPQGRELTCASADGRLQGFSATLDGRWGALRVQAGDKLVTSAVDLSSGQVFAKPDLLGALGNWLVTGTRRHVYGVADPSALAVPPSWAPLGAFSNATIPMDMPAEAVTGRFPIDDPQNPPASGLSSDGTVLFTRLAADGQGSRVDAYALPAMTRLWTQTTAGSSYLTILGSGGNTLVAEKTADDGSRTTLGLNARTGATLWTLPTGRRVRAEHHADAGVGQRADRGDRPGDRPAAVLLGAEDRLERQARPASARRCCPAASGSTPPPTASSSRQTLTP